MLDVMRVPVTGDPLSALVAVDESAPAQQVECDVLVVGGGLGGVAAAWAAARRGRKVCLLEETDWIGGQATSQGVSALDEHEHIEAFGGTRSYYQVREAVRDYYRGLLVEPQAAGPLNPGSCWVTRLAFEPLVGLRALETLLAPQVDAGLIQVFLRTKAVSASVEGDRVVSLTAVNLDDGSTTRFEFEYVLDATELGDLLPMTGAEYVVGAESVAETGEPHAQPQEAKAHCVQSCTYTFAMERRPPGEDHRIPKPGRYDHYSRAQPYSLRIHVHGGEIYGEESGWLDYHVFQDSPGTKGPLWRYRRLVDAEQFPCRYDHDVTMFNWPGNDYRDKPLVDQSPEGLAFALQDAKRVSLGFAYWLQSDAPSPDGPAGFPNILLRPDVMGSVDGLSKHPYIRESRRIRAVRTICGAGRGGRASEGASRGTFRRLCRRRLVPHRHPPGQRRQGGNEHPYQAVSDTTRGADSSPSREPYRGQQEYRDHAHNQRVLPAPSGRVEHRRVGRGTGRLCLANRQAAQRGPQGQGPAAVVPARFNSRGGPALLGDRRAGHEW